MQKQRTVKERMRNKMKLSDILGMSLTNLWRRKTRTFLTVLGVIIGTASIVVMLSLGIGMKQAMMEQVGSQGGLKEIMVYSGDDYGLEDLVLSDATIDKFMQIDHVESVDPQLTFTMPIQVDGKYENTIDLIGITAERLAEIPLGEGELPSIGSQLEMIAGNQLYTEFFDSATGTYPYLEGEEAPDINLMGGQVIAGLEEEESYVDMDTEGTGDSSTGYYDATFSDSAYDFSTEEDVFGTEDEEDFGGDVSDSEADTSDIVTEPSVTDTTATDGAMSMDGSMNYDMNMDMDFMDDEVSYSDFTSETKRVPVKITAMTEGDENTYTEYSDYCYTDIEILKSFLRQNYSENSLIPGQPTDRSGKPYRDLKYTMLTVNVDESSNVEDVMQIIQEQGYEAEANKEWIEATEKEFMIIEAVLGGIGAVAMLVAAISIANTMTMSTYERTKEIGVMKVLGCALSNIRSMFLAEAAVIGFIGGVIGVVLSFLLSFLVNQLAPSFVDMEFDLVSGAISHIPFWLVIVAILFSTVIGMLAGFFPAQRATRLSPLAAIRNE